MTELCKDLTLSIWREPDPNPKEKDKEQIRIRIEDPLAMLSVEVCEQINQTTMQSRRYHILEATVIVLRRAVSEAFKQGLIADTLGEWKVTRPKGTPKQEVEIDLDTLL